MHVYHWINSGHETECERGREKAREREPIEDGERLTRVFRFSPFDIEINYLWMIEIDSFAAKCSYGLELKVSYAL